MSKASRELRKMYREKGRFKRRLLFIALFVLSFVLFLITLGFLDEVQASLKKAIGEQLTWALIIIAGTTAYAIPFIAAVTIELKIKSHKEKKDEDKTSRSNMD